MFKINSFYFVFNDLLNLIIYKFFIGDEVKEVLAELEKIAPERKLKITRQLSTEMAIKPLIDLNKESGNVFKRLNSVKSTVSNKSITSGDEKLKLIQKNSTESLPNKVAQTQPLNALSMAARSRIIEKENIETGKVKSKVYLSYIRAIGFLTCFIFVLIYSFSSVLGIVSNLWLADWSDHAAEIQSKSNSTYETHKRLIIYTTLGMGQG